MQNRDHVLTPLEVAIHGLQLVEASAGTGKTYNIANLYLRLITGTCCSARTVEEILVVTFTRAATGELRGRIRDKIAEALLAFRSGNSNDLFIQQLLEKHDEESRQKVCRLLTDALLRMDEATIYTIHSFAIQAMQLFLFETGALAEVEVSEGGSERRQQLLQDLWRTLQLTGEPWANQWLELLGLSSAEKINSSYGGISPTCTIAPLMDIDSSLGIKANLGNLVTGVVGEHSDKKDALRTAWADLVQKKGEDFLKKAFGDKGNSSAVKKIGEYLQSDDVMEALDANTKWYERIENLANAVDSDKQLKSFCEKLLQHDNDSAVVEGSLKAGFCSLLQGGFSAIDLNQMSFDDVIRLVNERLADVNSADALRRVITNQWPVCMVDEFQDTDPEQFRMFSSLYGSSEQKEGVALFMIGDPKQSIYAFRGADIFSYLRVRQQVEQKQLGAKERSIHSLDTNFRSKASLVKAVNALFQEGGDDKQVFYQTGIGYEPVDSCEEKPFLKNKGRFTLLDAKGKQVEVKPLTVIGNAGEEPNGTKLVRYYAKDTAERISSLLATGEIEDGDGNCRKVKPSDIAVLVRSRHQAAAVRQALGNLRHPLGAVFESQRDSIFSTSVITTDLWLVLRAITNPSDSRSLKSALATPLLQGFTLDIHQINALVLDNDEAMEELIREFSGYRDCWKQHGILAALNRLLEQRKLGELMARQSDAARLMTDFRHFGELLQKRYLETGSMSRVLEWFGARLTDDSDLDEDAKRIRLESDENLVKIVTIHVSKGLEYPVVFLPFSSLTHVHKAGKGLPLVHPQERQYESVIDYARDEKEVEELQQEEQKAEDMRLLYVAVTRAKYACFIGLSSYVYGNGKKPMFPNTPWAHLLRNELGKSEAPNWEALKNALTTRIGEHYLSLRELGDVEEALESTQPAQEAKGDLREPVLPKLPTSHWVITSYSSLAHGKQASRNDGVRVEAEDATAEADAAKEEASAEAWRDNIRFSLKGSANTGECLHGIYESLAKNPELMQENSAEAAELFRSSLARYGLLKFSAVSEEEIVARQQKRVGEVQAWFGETLAVPLGDALPSLRDVFESGQLLPELGFDFSLGYHQGESPLLAQVREINRCLNAAGVGSINPMVFGAMEGIMTGAIDLLFLHENKVYVADYKSNTLGAVPDAYHQSAMARCMRDSRYDLQYLIYSVAVHRFMKARLGSRYSFDGGEFSFGGVIYLFIRGMGVPEEQEGLGIWQARPTAEVVESLDRAFAGGSHD